jgi:hypothetical protein
MRCRPLVVHHDHAILVLDVCLQHLVVQHAQRPSAVPLHCRGSWTRPVPICCSPRRLLHCTTAHLHECQNHGDATRGCSRCLRVFVDSGELYPAALLLHVLMMIPVDNIVKLSPIDEGSLHPARLCLHLCTFPSVFLMTMMDFIRVYLYAM